MDTVKAVSFNLLRYSVTIFEQIDTTQICICAIPVRRKLVKSQLQGYNSKKKVNFSFTLI